MARKLPWTGVSATSTSRHQRATTSSRSVPRPQPNSRGRANTKQSDFTTVISTPWKRHRTSRTPSTSPPPAPPDIEPMIEGYENDDIWMMVEDEFQSLAQSFTVHLHRAEYKRLMKKAQDAPRKQLPEPTSPMSKETQRKLQRKALFDKQQKALDSITGDSKMDGAPDDVEEEKEDDPWRGTALAGLMALGSQEKTSLKGLEKLPSSTRAAQGFLKARPKVAASKTDAMDELTALNRNSEPTRDEDAVTGSNEAGRARTGTDMSSRTSQSRRTAVDEVLAVSRRATTTLPASSEHASRPLRPSYLQKKKKVKEESKEDRLAEVPMFLI